jgi:rRNA-processing protein FCF1
VRQKIDFFEQIENLGFEIIVPEQVMKEIEKLTRHGKSLKLREQAELSLKILKVSKEGFRKVKMKSRNVDNGIKKFADANPQAIIATLDRELKKRTSNQKLVIRDKKKIEVI